MKIARTHPLSAVHVARLFPILALFSILMCVNVNFYVYGNPGAVFTHISVTNGNGVVDLVGGGTAKVYVGQTPKMNLTAQNVDLGLFGADLYTKFGSTASYETYVFKGSSTTWNWQWTSPATIPGTYPRTAELWWDNGGTQVQEDTKTFYILVVELHVSNWQAPPTTVQRGSSTPATLTVSFTNGGNDAMSNAKIEVIDAAGLNFQYQSDYLGTIAAGSSKSTDFLVTAPVAMPVGTYTVHFRISYDDFRGTTHTEEETAPVYVKNKLSKITLYLTSPITYGSAVQFTAYLTDWDNNALPSQTIAFLLNGTQVGTAVTDSSGRATYSTTSVLDCGTYLVQASFQSTQDYTGSTTPPSTLLIQKMRTSLTLTYVYEMKIGTQVQISATLKDSSYKPISGLTVNFYLDSLLIGSSATDQTGTASIRYTPSTPGSYNLKAIFTGTRNYDSSSSTLSVVVIAYSLKVVTPFANVPIVTVGQTQFTTDAYGTAEIPISSSGTYTVSVQEYYTEAPGIRSRFVQWADGTGTTSKTVSVSSDLTLTAQYKRQYLVSIVFRDATGTRIVTPDSMIAVGPNGSYNTLTAYSSVWLDEGQWTVSEILYQGIQVQLDSYRTLDVYAPAELTVRCAMYDLTVTVQDILGSKISECQVKITLPQGSTSERTTGQTGTVSFTIVPRGRFSVSATYMGFTATTDGDASTKNDIVVVVPMSTGTLVLGGVAVVGAVVAGYFILRGRRTRQEAPPPPPLPPSNVDNVPETPMEEQEPVEEKEAQGPRKKKRSSKKKSE